MKIFLIFQKSFYQKAPLSPWKDTPIPSPPSILTANEFPLPISDYSSSILGNQTSSLEDLLKTSTVPIQRTPTSPLLSPIFTAVTSPNSSFYISGTSPKTPSNILGTPSYFIDGISPNSSFYPSIF